MLRLLLCFAIFQLALGSCPDGFELVSGGQCRGLYISMSIRWDQATQTAINKCNALQINARPIIIHNDEQQAYWKAQMPWNKPQYIVVLGLECNTWSKKWEWTDGSPVDYFPAEGYYQGLNSSCTSGCYWYLTSNNGRWNNACGTGSNTMDIYCTTQLYQPTPEFQGCEEFEDDNDDGVCYQLTKSSETWQDAQEKCRGYGANLASVHNSSENSYIRRLAVANGAVNGIFLGGKSSGNTNKFEWADGSEWNYDNFYPGMPVNGLGNCLSLDTLGTTGQWVNTECSSKLPYACVRPYGVPPPPKCPSGPWNEGEIISSPGFPYDASVACDYILTVEAGKRVQVTVSTLEANDCCDHLILSDNIVGGNILANLTGEVSNKVYTNLASNLMRVSWQPHGGVNVRGMQFSFRGV